MSYANYANLFLIYAQIFLFSEVFLSFRDVSINKPLINSIELGKDANQKIERYERMQSYQAESGSRITKELLYEYFVRLIKFFNEPKVASHQESFEM